MKILYLSAYINHDDFMLRTRNKYENVTNEYLIKGKNLYIRILMGIGYYFFPYVLYLMYGDWKYRLNEYDVIVADSRRPSLYLITKLKKKYSGKLIVWYQNKMSYKELDPELCKKTGCETWSFDKEDCMKYHMNYNCQYFFEKCELKRNSKEYDGYYLGVYKPEREEYLKKIRTLFEKNGLVFESCLLREEKNNAEKKNSRIDYEDYLSEISKTRIIVEHNAFGQRGLTRRAMESIFFNKKLITNNPDICKYDFYSKENIFVYGVDDDNDFFKFVTSPYKSIDENIVKYYDFESWIKRMI